MAIDLEELIVRTRPAVITVECQRGVIGAKGPFAALSDAVRESGLVPRMASVLGAARAAGVPVLHGVVVRRPDGGGVVANCRLLAVAKKSPGPGLLPGSDAAALDPELGPEESDYIVSRHHGVSLFHDGELDSILRSLGVGSVILLGVSLNVALMGTTIEAVNRGYQVVMPTDGVLGTPPEYASMVLEHSMKLLATLTTCEAVVSALRSTPRASA